MDTGAAPSIRSKRHVHCSAATLLNLLGVTIAAARTEGTVTVDGERFVPLCWFPHPFYPQPEGDELCRLNIPVQMADNPGYTLAESGFIARRGWPECRC